VDTKIRPGADDRTPEPAYLEITMRTLDIAIGIIWIAFWVYWLAAASGAKETTGTGRTRRPPGMFIGILALIVIRAFHPAAATIHAPVVQAIGTILFVAGLGLAVWARVYLGRNWGMPMTQKQEPELVTSGPYSRVRHPIYTGILLAMVGTALASSLYWLVAAVITGTYFLYSATVEERNLNATFPSTYPDYQARTKKVIPFLL